MAKIFDETFIAIKMLVFAILMVLLFPVRILIWGICAIFDIIKDFFRERKGD